MAKTAKQTAPTVEPTSNGHGPRMSRHTAWLKVPGYEADGFEVLGWTNPSQKVLLDLDSRESSKVEPAMRALLLGCRTVTPSETFDHWFDCDGEPFPAADAPDFIDKIPTELLSMALRVVRYEGPHLQGASFLARLIAERRGSG